jgi:hypothetical protein
MKRIRKEGIREGKGKERCNFEKCIDGFFSFSCPFFPF